MFSGPLWLTGQKDVICCPELLSCAIDDSCQLDMPKQELWGTTWRIGTCVLHLWDFVVQSLSPGFCLHISVTKKKKTFERVEHRLEPRAPPAQRSGDVPWARATVTRRAREDGRSIAPEKHYGVSLSSKNQQIEELLSCGFCKEGGWFRAFYQGRLG